MVKMGVLLLALAVAGCGTTTTRKEYLAELQAMWDGRTLVVNQPVAMTNRRGTPYLAGGPMTRNVRFQPVCRVNLAPGPSGSIPPGRYTVQSVDYASRARAPRENIFNFFTIHLLKDGTPTGQIICHKESQGQLWRTPSVDQVNAVLGPAMRFQ